MIICSNIHQISQTIYVCWFCYICTKIIDKFSSCSSSNIISITIGVVLKSDWASNKVWKKGEIESRKQCFYSFFSFNVKAVFITCIIYNYVIALVTKRYENNRNVSFENELRLKRFKPRKVPSSIRNQMSEYGSRLFIILILQVTMMIVMLILLQLLFATSLKCHDNFYVLKVYSRVKSFGYNTIKWKCTGYCFTLSLVTFWWIICRNFII